MMKLYKYSFIFLILLLVPLVHHAQERREGFGQNRVQHKVFEWHYYSTEKFDIYYYQGGADYARLAIDYLDEEYNRITDLLGYAPFNKTTIFLFNSYTDLQQSNIGIDGDHFSIAGQTNFVKLHTEIAYPGSAEKFKEELTFKMTEVLLNDMMFGGSLAEMFQSAYLLSLPNWFIKGAASYITYGWNAEMDDYIRDFLARKNVRKLSRLDENDARLVGQSVWNYIAVRYGNGNISNILNLTRIIRNEENSIASTLVTRYRTFVLEWQNYYLSSSNRIKQDYTSPDSENILVERKNYGYEFSQVRVNPSGTKIAYSQRYEGKYRVIVYDIESGNIEVIQKGGNKVLTQETNHNLPLIDWMNDHTIGYIYDKYGKYVLEYFDLEARQRYQKSLNRFEQIHDFSFNHNGKLAILSANTDKMNDLFLISMRRTAIKRLTKDMYDDIHPQFVPGTDAIVFSSNRMTKYLDEAEGARSLEEVSNNHSLYIYDLDTTQNELKQLTNNLGKDFYPTPQNDQYIFYLSDQKGIINLFRYDLFDDTYQQVTAFDMSIIEFDLNGLNDEFTYLMLDNGNYKVFLDKNFDLTQSTFTPQSLRQDMIQAKFLINRIETRTPSEVEKDPLLPDSLLAKDPVDNEALEEEVIENIPSASDSIPPDEDAYIEADDYEFEEETRFKNESLSFLSTYSQLEKEPSIVGPIKYTPRFSMSNIVTSFVIDPIRDFGILLEGEMSDMLENHKFYGGALFMTDFQNGDIFGEYQYLKNRIDFKVRFDRQVYVFEEPIRDPMVQRYSLNKIEFGASYPFNNALRFSVNPFFATTSYRNLQSTIIAFDSLNNYETNFYTGFMTELVLDNTKIFGLNLYNGTRGKVKYTYYGAVSDFNSSFGKLEIDIRNYLPIHREFTFATRVSYGNFMSKRRQNFMLGGMLNWPFSQSPIVTGETSEQIPQDYPFVLSNDRPITGILFTDFIPLRGYNYGEVYGSEYLALNAELRLPVFRYLSKGPISSNFLRNFQAIGFYDLGAAWTGTAPFRRSSSVSSYDVNYPPGLFSATINNFRNVWLASFGFGFRTVILGYYVRFDWAKPIEDFEIGKTKFYFTLGYDF